MGIFFTLSPSGNVSVPGLVTWYRNLYEPLLGLAHDVYLLRLDLFAEERHLKRPTSEFQQEFSQKLLETFVSEHSNKLFDFFLSYLTDSEVDTTCLDKIRRVGVPTANFSCNNVHQFYEVQNISSHFDFSLYSEKSVADKFVAVGARPVWFQMAANPKYYHPINIEKNLDVVFVRGCYPKRPYYIWNLLEN